MCVAVAAERLGAVKGCSVVNEAFFNEFTLRVPVDARQLVRDLAAKGVLAGVGLGKLFPDGEGRENGLLVTVTETVSEADIQAFVSALEEVLP